MNRVIPIMPCKSIKEQAAFYEAMGFEITALYTNPNPYAAVKYEDIELHFYGSSKLRPNENATMCFVEVDDVDAICKTFTDNLKAKLGKAPRSGFPRITKVRDLASDRRFTLSDVSGNTFYVGTPRKQGQEDFYRILSNTKHAKKFAVLYDFLYSKEDDSLARAYLDKILPAYNELNDLDKAKLLLVKLEILSRTGEATDDGDLLELLERHKGSEQWDRILEKYEGMLGSE